MITAVLSALQDEIQALVDRMINLHSISALGKRFYLGEVEGRTIVVVASGVGKVRASACVQYLIDAFDIEQLVIFGSAGALNTDLKLGDIVISKTAIMHDYSVASEGVNEAITVDPVHADPHLIELAILASRSLAGDHNIRAGIVLTGDTAIADSRRRAQLRREFEGDCVEMEGAAAALVCTMNKIPFVIIRVISDLADEEAHRQFQNYLELASDRCAAVIIEMLRLISCSVHNQSKKKDSPEKCGDFLHDTNWLAPPPVWIKM
jgi:adenosylhomocysteine nucleosidase